MRFLGYVDELNKLIKNSDPDFTDLRMGGKKTYKKNNKQRKTRKYH